MILFYCKTGKEIGIYLISLLLLFILLLIDSIDIPIYCGEDWQFIGWNNLLGRNIITIVLLILILICCVCIFTFTKEIKGCHGHPYKIEQIENNNENYLTFFATYVIPFLGFEFGSVRGFTLVVLLLILNGILLVKTNLYIQNPTLGLLGFNIYKAQIMREGKTITCILFSKDKLAEGDTILKHDFKYNEVAFARLAI